MICLIFYSLFDPILDKLGRPGLLVFLLVCTGVIEVKGKMLGGGLEKSAIGKATASPFFGDEGIPKGGIGKALAPFVSLDIPGDGLSSLFYRIISYHSYLFDQIANYFNN